MTRTCASCKYVRPTGGICKKGIHMDARGIRRDCKNWQKQDCTNCQYLSKDATDYYYRSTHKLWFIGRGNPFTNESCEGCELREYGMVKGLIEQVKRDACDIYEIIGCLDAEKVSGRRELVSILELIAENISTSANKGGTLGLRARELERTGQRIEEDIGEMIILQREDMINAGYNI
ncbi:hypothetical protein CUJ83_08035 [Methanocella sp. CWC-04]|uniref:Uncharacterized protein n=1 Tax=Methanooceanicella nereidis TaxID=2052831 RepID=A0AAP2W4Z9_9EURY|nr:hypothetical protein [Methanocella sp. CWC-04]MCD1294945.1 hypothetical protein [Methanocella sp. CWC-04]